MLYIKSFTFNPFQENTYLLYDEKGIGTLIDPGCFDLAERKELLDFLTQEKIRITQLLNTHCHIDHVLGNAWAKKTFGVDLLIHKEEVAVLKAVEVYAPNYGFVGYETSEADGYLTEGGEIKVGAEALKIIFVPGHAPGHIIFINHAEKYVIGGDCLFRESIGRTDLPGGDHQTLLDSIRAKMFTLPDDYVVYPGHGLETSIGYEKKNNPFLR